MLHLISVDEFKCQVCDEKENGVLLKTMKFEVDNYNSQSNKSIFDHVFYMFSSFFLS